MAHAFVDLAAERLLSGAKQVGNFWGSLSPKTRRNVKIGASVVAAAVVVTVVVMATRRRSSGSGASDNDHAADSALDNMLDLMSGSRASTTESQAGVPSANRSETLTEFLNKGGSVAASDFDAKVSDLGDMARHNAVRYGYMGDDGYWTDRGYGRATSRDYANLQAANDAMAQRRDAAEDA